MFALDVTELISERRQEVLIGCQDLARWRELDDGLRARQRIELARVFERLQLLNCDIRSELDDLVRLAAAKDGIVGCFIQISLPPLPMRLYWRWSYFPAAKAFQNCRYSALEASAGSTNIW